MSKHKYILLRPCRECKQLYKHPNEWNGYCSELCRLKKSEFLKKNPQQKKTFIDLNDNPAWLRLRYLAFKKYGRKCCICGAKGQLHVDHIKPRSKYPHLTYDIMNLQILCRACNIGKSNKFEDDWRKK